MDNPRDVLVAFLHDPPDKAIQIQGHEARARGYLRVALGDTVSEAELKDVSDSMAAIAERLPSPNWQTLTVSCENGQFRTRHPLSAADKTITIGDWQQSAVRHTIEQMVDGIDDTARRFLVLWRKLEDELSDKSGAWFRDLPADTRVPDHTIWQHLDTTAGLKAAQGGERPGCGLALLFHRPRPVVHRRRTLGAGLVVREHDSRVADLPGNVADHRASGTGVAGLSRFARLALVGSVAA